MDSHTQEENYNRTASTDRNYSWTQEQLEDYEESWARDNDHQY